AGAITLATTQPFSAAFNINLGTGASAGLTENDATVTNNTITTNAGLLTNGGNVSAVAGGSVTLAATAGSSVTASGAAAA
ncbi:hypothetical protein, partial [Escherichia coli]|uniref:hypothetical protein n=1 Tax=Escherichia coli TaxID=562 RepID=UPI0039DF996E